MRPDRQGGGMVASMLITAAWLVLSCGGGGAVEAGEMRVAPNHRDNHNTMEADLSASSPQQEMSATMQLPPRSNASDPFLQLEKFKEFRRQAAQERKNRYRKERQQQGNNRQQRAQEFLQKLPKAPKGPIERVSPEEFERMDQTQKIRGLNWWGGSSTSDAYSSSVLLDPSQYYDKWAQAYRMLGGFIDCDHDKDGDSHDSGGDNDNNNGNYDDNSACSRWMMWAAYVNPNYQGNEYYEYFGDDPTSVLDCHNPDSDWQLLGVYRQEFYQYIEQISKHLWAIDEYEYVVALAGLAYMTDYDCFYVGADSSGNSIYAGVAPKPYGKFEMALYTDGYCLEPNDSLGMTFDDYGLTSDISLGSGDDTDDYSDVYDWWYDAQEYTLTNLNDVYEEFKYCTSCVDYPTYQDGYFIGDYGTDDDDLINQCWKFYSHDSFTCEAECIAMAHAQGTILSVKYGDSVFGSSMSGFYTASSGTSSPIESRFSRLLANVFLTAAFLLFVATFLAFAVARRSRYRESRHSKSRRLLDDDHGDSRSRRSRRSKSRSKAATEDDGLFRSSPSSKRSKSRSKSHRSASKSRRSSHSKSREKSRTRSPRNEGDYY